MKAQLTRISRNVKTGLIPVSMTERKSCPKSCPWYQKGCYALSGNLNIHWPKVSERGVEWDHFCSLVKFLPRNQLWRHNECGDLPGNNLIINSIMLMRLVAANKNKKGFTYTAKPVLGESETNKRNRTLILYANQNGFTINLSGHNLDHADKLYDLNIGPVTVVLPKDTIAKVLYTPQGRKVNICPASYNKNITCSNCQICANANRKNIIGFPAHGAAAKTVSEKCK